MEEFLPRMSLRSEQISKKKYPKEIQRGVRWLCLRGLQP